MAIGISACDSWKLEDLMTDIMLTICGLEFGTSIPIVPKPGIGAMIRMMPRAPRLMAMSSSRFLIFEMRMPGAGTIS